MVPTRASTYEERKRHNILRPAQGASVICTALVREDDGMTHQRLQARASGGLRSPGFENVGENQGQQHSRARAGPQPDRQPGERRAPSRISARRLNRHGFCAASFAV